MSKTPHHSKQVGATYVERFALLWDGQSAPDVFSFLRAERCTTLAELLEVLRFDQVKRSETDQLLPIDRYFDQGLPLNDDAKVSLIVGDFACRRASGEYPDIEEYVQRFSVFADRLSNLLVCERGGEKKLEPTLDHTGSEVVEASEETVGLPFKTGAESVAVSIPAAVGRYQIVRVLGRGAFGQVYLARDEELARLVAVKIPHQSRIRTETDIETYLAEARVLASLDHPAIVPVHDVGRTQDGRCFLVSRFIEGSDLGTRLSKAPLTHLEAAQLIATVAEALHHAHGKGLVHRDVKPENILIDTTGRPWLADFGLALREEDLGHGPAFMGTPAYMSPEQARGEGHLVDGRSDIFSLGATFYVLLVGRKPFNGQSTAAVLDQIKTLEPRPPRQVNDSISAELERICLKAMSKRISERYTTALDMANDIRRFFDEGVHSDGTPLAYSSSPSAGSRESASSRGASTQKFLTIVPHGLRSFDQNDADFFLELLPGVRDRDGMPESLHFWKRQVDESDGDATFRVGLMYGPSGCGKSSMLRAGLIPRLAPHVTPILIEATTDETEAHLLRALRRSYPQLSPGLGLIDTLASLRRGSAQRGERKILIILDQFEQWLHAHRGEDATTLGAALRQCDGGRIQCILLVRDDFWMAVTRFLRELDIRLIEGHNSAAVDLFDLRHARKVLMAFGRAYEALPANPRDVSQEQQQFIQEAVDGLAEDGKVISVRLALFAEMVKDKDWLSATLKNVGGTEGVGATFLEETFTSSSAPPEHRLHQRAARAVLEELLPSHGTDIKGHMKSWSELLDVSGYARRLDEFKDLIRILDSQLKLLTPIDPEGIGDEPASEDLDRRCYQLAHDYLVPSLREWLTRKQRETKRGRAELRFGEQSELWNVRRETRLLPSLFDFVRFRFLTDRSRWSDPQREMMRAATWRHGSRSAVIAAMLFIFVAAGLTVKAQVDRGRRDSQLQALVQQLLVAETPRLSEVATRLDQFDHPQRQAVVREIIDDDSRSIDERFRAQLLLVPYDESFLAPLLERLNKTTPDEHRAILARIRPSREQTADFLISRIRNEQTSFASRLRAGCALSQLDSEDAEWPALAASVAESLLQHANLSDASEWIAMLVPNRDDLRGPVESYFRDQRSKETGRLIAVTTLVKFSQSQPVELVDVIPFAEAAEFPILIDALRASSNGALPLLQVKLLPNVGTESSAVRHRARIMMALAQLGHEPSYWDGLQNRPDPRVRTRLIHDSARFGIDPEMLLRGLQSEQEPTVRQAALIALAEYAELPSAVRERLLTMLPSLYQTDSNAAVHSGAEWLLRQFDLAPQISRTPAAEMRSEMEWYVNGQQITMIRIDAPQEFTFGSPESETEREIFEPQRRVHLSHSFEISAHSVTVNQFRGFSPAFPYPTPVTFDLEAPCGDVRWYDAVQYCRWLSEQEGVAEDQMCYPPINEIGPGMKLPERWWERTGYRLPSEEEWECACRAGTETARFFGDTADDLIRYGWYMANAEDELKPVGRLRPNPWGLFDVYGGVLEWSHEPTETITETATMRSGYYRSIARENRSAKRFVGYALDKRFSYYGLRVARSRPR